MTKSSLKATLKYPVPAHANSIFYMFGGITIMAFVILVLSGIYLSQVYNPAPEAAHRSITYFITDIPLADFMRSLHWWAANLMLILILMHLIRVFITGSYKKPRRSIWLSGVGLLATTYLIFFVGTLLKWDQEAVEAFGHAKESFALLGIHIGTTNAGVPVITQLYSWHIIILEVLFITELAIHLFLIKVRGISPAVTKSAIAKATSGHGSSTFLTHISRLCGFGLVFLAVAGLLAIIFPASIGNAGIAGHEVTRPLWPFWPFYGLENIFGMKGLVWGMISFFAILAVIPFIDRSPYLHYAKRKLIMTFGVILATATIGLAVYARVNPVESHLEMTAGSAAGEKPTAESIEIPHQQLYREALYLAPLLAGIGTAGFYIAYRKQE